MTPRCRLNYGADKSELINVLLGVDSGVLKGRWLNFLSD